MWTFPLTYVNGFTQIYLAKTAYDGYFNTSCLFTTVVHKWEEPNICGNAKILLSRPRVPGVLVNKQYYLESQTEIIKEEQKYTYKHLILLN